jgi:hypothetical protein
LCRWVWLRLDISEGRLIEVGTKGQQVTYYKLGKLDFYSLKVN